MTERVAVVTGAARGIGLATSTLLLNKGVSVAMVDRDAEALAQSSANLTNVLPLNHDVSDPDQADVLINATLSRYGRIDCLVNNAGVADFGPIEQTSFERWRRVMATNLDGVFLCSQAATPALKESAGCIVCLLYTSPSPRDRG